MPSVTYTILKELRPRCTTRMWLDRDSSKYVQLYIDSRCVNIYILWPFSYNVDISIHGHSPKVKIKHLSYILHVHVQFFLFVTGHGGCPSTLHINRRCFWLDEPGLWQHLPSLKRPYQTYVGDWRHKVCTSFYLNILIRRKGPWNCNFHQMLGLTLIVICFELFSPSFIVQANKI